MFTKVAKGVIDNCLAGYNGTIFAYGQTGSGKTFTVTGKVWTTQACSVTWNSGTFICSPKWLNFELRRPREICRSWINSEDTELSFSTIHETKWICLQDTRLVSRGENLGFSLASLPRKVLELYFQLYNESGYDLLDPLHDIKQMEDLTKVTILEDGSGNNTLWTNGLLNGVLGGIKIRNLSTVAISTEEEGINQLFIGDTNRAIAETPMNQASTRSHCIFTIHLEIMTPGEPLVKRSKPGLLYFKAKKAMQGKSLWYSYFLAQIKVTFGRFGWIRKNWKGWSHRTNCHRGKIYQLIITLSRAGTQIMTIYSSWLILGDCRAVRKETWSRAVPKFNFNLCASRFVRRQCINYYDCNNITREKKLARIFGDM